MEGTITFEIDSDNGPIFQKIVLFHEKLDSSQYPLIRGL